MPTTTPVFPVNAPFNTDPAYSGSFIPTLWSKKLLIKFYQNLMLSEIVNTDYEGELKNQGDTVRIRSVPDVTIRKYEIGNNLQYEVPTPIFQDMVVDQGNYFGVKVNDVLAYQSDMDLMNMFTSEASKQMRLAVEEEVFYHSFVTSGPAPENEGHSAGAMSGEYDLGTDTTPIEHSNPDNILNAIFRMSAALDEQDVPPDDRWLLMSPYHRHILLQSDIAASFFSGDSSSIVRTGKIGRIDRFTTYVSNLLPFGAAGKALVSGRGKPSEAPDLPGAKRRSLMVAGTKHAISFAATIDKTEPIRSQTDFGDIVRGLMVYGRKVVKPEAMTIAVIGAN